MNDPIADILGRTVFAGVAINLGNACGVGIGFGDPDDEDPDIRPVLILDPAMAVALARSIVDTAELTLAEGDSDQPAAHTVDGHRHAALVGRLMLACITDDPDAWQRAAEDVGDCPGCWQKTAHGLATIATNEAIEHHGHDDAITMAENFITAALDRTDKDGGNEA